jgi:hypothetical protein
MCCPLPRAPQVEAGSPLLDVIDKLNAGAALEDCRADMLGWAQQRNITMQVRHHCSRQRPL